MTRCVEIDRESCLTAFLGRDRRFAGRFYAGVTSTGIYCRPGCPAPLPKARNVLFFRCAAAAEEAGFRACLRCRPETAPGTPAWTGTSATVARALRQIEAGVADDGPLSALAARLGVGERHLRRLFAEHLGASPVAIARTRRLHFARRLLDDTSLRMSDVALAAGYSSVRRFNEAMRAAFGVPPGQLRRSAAAIPVRAGIALNLPFRPPFDEASLLAFLAARAVPGVEEVSDGVYRRTAELAGSAGIVEARVDGNRGTLSLRLSGLGPASALEASRRAGRLFDLDADPVTISAHLAADPLLAPLVARRPGLRVPGAWDPFEIAVRTILGQQVSVKAARTLAARLAATFGRPLPSGAAREGLSLLFPRAEELAEADVASIGLTSRRAGTLRALSRELALGHIDLGPAASLDEAERRLATIPGIGPWTAQVIALRALGEPDTLPAGDLGLRKALANGGSLPSIADVEERARAWRPWRAYALIHLWTELASKERP
ncbi:MAG: DNA-3-methyladenine glycosylase 2 family protein [Deltaproteobacteria bacterium]|nr:DNA-3-methyladenine glycosylase 2 family protein [Deltaproteobacteria bacterium]